mmetsp:Transcript_8756/g.12963  ORF Transcript_8756/g.12963 Transcript_8756/m.12963 type:complete len:547 (-) Transcript_8756:64-1704(-)
MNRKNDQLVEKKQNENIEEEPTMETKEKIKATKRSELSYRFRYLYANIIVPNLLIRSDSLFGIIYDSFYVFVSVYFSLEVILGLVLMYNPPIYLIVIDVCIGCIQIIQILIGFSIARTKFDDSDQKKHKRVAFYYFRTWFTIDVLSALPIDLILVILVRTIQNEGTAYKLLLSYKIIRILKLARLIRVPFLFNTSNIIKKSRMKKYSNFVQFFFWFLVCVHWVACLWMLLRPDDALRHNEATRYVLSVYWAVTTLTTVGYGDIVVDTNVQRIFCTAVMIVGVGAYGFVIGNISLVLMKQDVVRTNQQKQIRELSSLMNFYKVPSQIQQEVMSFQQHSLQQSTIDNYSEIIKNLPSSMQERIRSYVKIKVISDFPLFKNVSSDCLEALSKALKQVYADPKDDIIHYGDIGREMYFLAHGSVEVLTREGKQVATIDEGFFGEIALFYSSKRTATIRALTYCSLFQLDKVDFLRIMNSFPDLTKQVRTEMSKRMNDLKAKGTKENLPDSKFTHAMTDTAQSPIVDEIMDSDTKHTESENPFLEFYSATP